MKAYMPLNLRKVDLKFKMASLHDKMEAETITKEVIKEENLFFQKYHKALKVEEMWRLKYKNIWLNYGDRNTSFFHMKEKYIIKRNIVKEIIMGYRSIIMNFSNIKEETRTHLEELYTKSIGVDPTIKTKILENIPSLISSHEIAKLIK
jgi:hypothetical protein